MKADSTRDASREADFDLAGLVSALEKQFSDLVAAGAAAADPVRCRLVKSLLERYQQNPSAYLLERTRQTLEQLATKTSKATESAARIRDRLQQHHPEKAQEAEALFEQGNWQALNHLDIRLNHRTRHQSVMLHKLRRQVISGELVNPLLAGNLSFDDFLMSQEQEILDAVRQESGGDDNRGDNSAGAPDTMPELRSIKHFRESWVKHNSEKLLAQAIADSPRDAGPLNSHRLAIQSLTAMRDLSPEYLNRFLSYLETLLWLEKAGESIGLSSKNAKSKKPGSAR